MSPIFYLGFILCQKTSNFLDIFETLFSEYHKIKTRTSKENLRHTSLGIGMKKYHTKFHINIFDSY